MCGINNGRGRHSLLAPLSFSFFPVFFSSLPCCFPPLSFSLPPSFFLGFFSLLPRSLSPLLLFLSLSPSPPPFLCLFLPLLFFYRFISSPLSFFLSPSFSLPFFLPSLVTLAFFLLFLSSFFNLSSLLVLPHSLPLSIALLSSLLRCPSLPPFPS